MYLCILSAIFCICQAGLGPVWVAVTVGFIRATHVWVKFFVAAAARFIPPFMTRARKLQQTTFKNNGDGNGHGQWQWLWLLLSLVQKCCTIPSEPSHRWRGRRGVSRILFYRECARLQFIGTTDDAPRIYWSWSPLPCLASTSLSSGSLNFFAHLHLGVLGLGIHIFWGHCFGPCVM